MFRATRRGLLVGASIGFLALAGGVLPVTASTDADAQELEEIRFGLGPYFEYQPWAIAKDLGLDKEMGFDFVLQTVNKVSHAVAGLQTGQYHATFSCQTCTIPFYENVPTLRNWMVTNQFKGFAIIGRRGQTPTYAELVGELGHDKAKEEVLLSMKGKSFAIVKVNHGPHGGFGTPAGRALARRRGSAQLPGSSDGRLRLRKRRGRLLHRVRCRSRSGCSPWAMSTSTSAGTRFSARQGSGTRPCCRTRPGSRKTRRER